MKLYKDIVLYLIVAVLAGMVTGCANAIFDHYPPEEDPSEGQRVMLVLSVAPITPTRASADNDRETMHSLRIVLLDEGGRVEHNRLVTFSGSGTTSYGEGSPGFQFIQTTPGNKKIFLIANEESLRSVQMTNDAYAPFNRQSLTAVLDSRPADSEATDFETLVNSIYFKPGDYSGMNIPLTSSYAFEINEEDYAPDSRRIKKEFYLVHAATKFDFRFENYRVAPVTVDELTLSSVADDMYLMAHFTDENGQMVPAEEKTVTWIPTDSNLPRTEYWIDWLKLVSEDTNNEPDLPDNKDVNSEYGWILDYSLPTTVHEEKTMVSNWSPSIPAVSDGTFNIIPGVGEIQPSFYVPESRWMPDGVSQKYNMKLRLTDTGLGTTYTQTFELDNLTLFRNTHVKVTVSIGYKGEEIDMAVEVGICPWIEETVEIPSLD